MGLLGNSSKPRLLKYPHPFKSALAFVSDIDTTTFPSFAHVHRCFYGLAEGYEGVELEFPNSLWLMNTQGDDNPRKKNYIYALKPNGKERPFVKGRLAPFLRSRLFDTIHTYGQFKNGKFSRADAETCLEYAVANDIKIDFWTYHGSRNQVQNVVPGDDDWRGDDPKTEGYHLNLLRDYGIKFFRVPPSLDIYEPGAHKKIVKARDGSKIYSVACHASILRPPHADDIRAWVHHLIDTGQLPFEDWRILQSSPRFPDRVISWKAEMLPFQLHETVLDKLVKSESALYLNQHLTQGFSAYAYQLDPVRAALRRLSDYQKSGKILVSGPARLIRFEYVRDALKYTVNSDASGKMVIDINPDMSCAAFNMTATAADLAGIGFSLPAASDACITLGGMAVESSIIQSDNSTVIQVPWPSYLEEQRAAIEEFAATFKDENG